MRKRGHHGLSVTTIGVIAIAVIAIAVYLGFTKEIPFKHHFEIKAVFRTSNNIAINSPVRIAGVNVGKVVSVEHTAPGDQSVTATLRIDSKGQPIHKDARAAVRPRIFLEGNFFVDLQPGTPEAPVLGDGDVIPINQTSSPVQLDQILGALQSDTREDLKLLLKEYGAALQGRGAKGYNASIKYWMPAYRDGAIVADAQLGTEQHDLSEYLRSATKVAQALDASPRALQSLVADFDTTAAAFAARSTDLENAIAELPRTLRAAQPALGALNASFPPLRVLARTLRPGVRSSGPAIDASMPLLKQLNGLVSQPELRGLVADLRSSAPSLNRLTDATVPLYEQVRLASSCQNEVILPWTQMKVPDTVFPAEGKVYEESTKPLPGLAGESRSGDANGQWFRVLAAGGTNLVTLKPGVFAATAAPISGTNPPKPTSGPPPLNENVPCETQQAPNLQSKPGPPPPQHEINMNDPAVIARVALDKARFVDWLKQDLKLEGLDKLGYKVSSEDVTRPLLDKLAAARGVKLP